MSEVGRWTLVVGVVKWRLGRSGVGMGFGLNVGQ